MSLSKISNLGVIYPKVPSEDKDSFHASGIIGFGRRSSTMAQLAKVLKGEKKTAVLQDLKETEFEEKVLRSKKPVLVFMTAPWCVPCQKLKPIIEEVAQSYLTSVQFFMMNFDNLSDDFKDKWGRQQIPILFLFNNGALIESAKGYLANSPEEIESPIEEPSTKQKNRKRIVKLVNKLIAPPKYP